MAPSKPSEKKKEKTKSDKADATKKGGVVKPHRKVGKPRNYDLGNGIYRFSRTRMFHKTAKYLFIGQKHPRAPKRSKPKTIVKPIGGEKNGGTRIVLVKKKRNSYPTAKKINRHPSKKSFKDHKRYTRRSLKAGTVCILLAGRHKGKRVVLLKILKSGLLLVTGPYKINGCPLRRISQNYVIATKTRLNISSFRIPQNLNDDYFKRKRPKRPKKEEGDIFAKKKEGYVISDKRKADQQVVDKAILEAMKKHPDKPVLIRYLGAKFGLKKTQYPHRLKF